MLEDEQQIIEKAKKDPRAFGAVFDEYYNVIFNYTLRRVANVHISRDIVSEVFYKALTKIEKFEWRGISILNWLYRIANNEIAQQFRTPHRKIISLDHLKDLNVQFASNNNLEQEMLKAERELERQQEFVKIQKKIAQLPIKYQEVLSLRFFEEKKLCEIAQITDKNENSVKALLYRGLEKLKKMN